MNTQLEEARRGRITEQMKTVATDEGVAPEQVREYVALGEIVIPCNPRRPRQKIVGIGTGLRTKVNGSIGTSSDICDPDQEVVKARAAEDEGADTLMELSPSFQEKCHQITKQRIQNYEELLDKKHSQMVDWAEEAKKAHLERMLKEER